MRCWHCGHTFHPEAPGNNLVEVVCSICGAKLGAILPTQALAPPERKTFQPEPTARTVGFARLRRMPRPKNRGNPVLLIGGIFCLVMAGYQFWLSWNIFSSYEKTRGHIVEKEPVNTARCNSAQCDSWLATVIFYTPDGKRYYASPTKVNSGRVGENVDVFYLPNNPSNNHTHAITGLWTYTIAWGFVTCLLLVGWMISTGNRAGRILGWG